jgi:selenocysteine-specific elongation factor
VSIVDVPGHERFIKNMLAGAGGLDAALLVIAADEGPMPQTEEHLAILHLLGVSRGIAVLTKRDTVDDEWLGLVEEEVRERLKGTTLEGAPIMAVSARTGQGLEELKREVDRLLQETEPRADKGRPRLPVDRAFTIAGFGTVVTGTLTDGRLKVGQEVEIVPGGLRSRIRGLQSHKHRVESIGPGNRVAVNLVGVEVDDLARGMVLTLPGTLEPSTRVDVHLELLVGSPVTLEQNSSLDFFTGASETPVQATLLDADRLEPGQGGLVQLRLRGPVALAKGDRYIVRRPSPSLTIGGGEVIDPHPRRHKRFSEETLQTLRTLQQGTPEELLVEALGKTPQEVRAVVEKSGVEAGAALEAIRKLLAGGQVLQLSGQEHSALGPQSSALVMSYPAWEALMKRVVTLLGHHHHHQPLRRGMSKEELRSRLAREVPPKAFPHVMGVGVSRGVIGEDATTYRLPGFEPTFSPQQRKQVGRLMELHEASPYSPPAPSEVGIDGEVVAALVESGELVKLDEGLLYTRRAYEEMRERILRAIDEQGEINVGIMRELFGTTRKYAIPFLEHLDEQKVTRRVGDVRVRW